MSRTEMCRAQRLAMTVFIGTLLAFAPGVCRAQQHTGQIYGSVKDKSGNGITGALVVVSTQEDGTQVKRALTDSSGRYSLLELRYGTYRLAVSVGLKEAQSKLMILATPTQTVDFNLIREDEGEPPPNSVGERPEGTGNSKPAFSPSGAEGTIAPSGYSSGLSSEEAAQVSDRVRDLDRDLLSDIRSIENVPGCDQESRLLSAVQANPKGFDPNHALGAFYLYHGEFAQGVQYLETANAISPGDKTNARDLVLALLGAKRNSDAATFLEHMIASGSGESEFQRLLAITYEEMGEANSAKAAYLKASIMDPSAQNQLDCGLGLIRIGAVAEAYDLLASAVVAHPEEARLWMGLGITQDLQQRKAEAVQSLLRAVDLDSEYAAPYGFLAELADASPAAEEEIGRRLSAFLVAHPESAAAHYDYALMLFKQRAQPAPGSSNLEIVLQLKRALELEPTMARAHYQLGVVYSDSGDLVDAAKELLEAVRLEPGNAEAHFRLAYVYRRNQQSTLADSEIRTFQSLRGQSRDPNGSAAVLIEGSAAPASRPIPTAGECPAKHR